jgi:hypothetical protein
VSTADVAAVASAALAAVAASASWASVFQNRRDRIEATKPAMTIDLITDGQTGHVQVHLTNGGGGTARGVEFAAAAPATGQMVFGVPHPAPLFRSGESRLIETGINCDPTLELVGFVSCYDNTGKHLSVWWPNGEHHTYRIGVDAPNRQELMAVVKPGFNVTRMQPVRYKTIERTL